MLLAQTIIFGLTLIAIVWYAEITRRMYREIKRQADTALESHKSYKLSVAADWLLKLQQEFDGIELTKARFYVAQFRRQLITNPELAPDTAIHDLMEELWDFFETLGVLLKRGLLDKELIHTQFFHWVNGYWYLTKRYLEAERKENDPRWKNFVYLANELRKIEAHQYCRSKDLEWSNSEYEEFIEQEFTSNKAALKRLGGTPFNKL
jgi:hypothetical protein